MESPGSTGDSDSELRVVTPAIKVKKGAFQGTNGRIDFAGE
jgi:hypothetical protein